MLVSDSFNHNHHYQNYYLDPTDDAVLMDDLSSRATTTTGSSSGCSASVVSDYTGMTVHQFADDSVFCPVSTLGMSVPPIEDDQPEDDDDDDSTTCAVSNVAVPHDQECNTTVSSLTTTTTTATKDKILQTLNPIVVDDTASCGVSTLSGGVSSYNPTVIHTHHHPDNATIVSELSNETAGRKPLRRVSFQEDGASEVSSVTTSRSNKHGGSSVSSYSTISTKASTKSRSNLIAILEKDDDPLVAVHQQLDLLEAKYVQQEKGFDHSKRSGASLTGIFKHLFTATKRSRSGLAA